MQQREGRRSSKWRTGLEEMCLPPTDYVRVFRTGRVKITSTWAETGESAGIGPTILNFDQESPLELMVAELKRDHFASASTYENCSPSTYQRSSPSILFCPSDLRSVHPSAKPLGPFPVRSLLPRSVPSSPGPGPAGRPTASSSRHSSRAAPPVPTLSLAVASRSRFVRPPLSISLRMEWASCSPPSCVASPPRRLASSPHDCTCALEGQLHATRDATSPFRVCGVARRVVAWRSRIPSSKKVICAMKSAIHWIGISY